MFLYLLNISLPFPIVYIAVFGVTLLYADRSLISALTKGGKGGHLFRLTFSVVL